HTSEIPMFQTSDAAARPTKSFCPYLCSSASLTDSQNFRTRSTIQTAPEFRCAETYERQSFETTSIPCCVPSRTASSWKERANAARNSAPCSSCRSWSACPASQRECACRKSATTAPTAAALQQCVGNAHRAKSLDQSSSKMDASRRPQLVIPRAPPPRPILRECDASRFAAPPRSRKYSSPSQRST